MDRKNEFAARVRAIDDAHERRDGKTLRGESADLDAEVAALRRRLAAGEKNAVSEALDLLEIRQPVFGLGYAQEKLLRSVKGAELDGSQIGRLEFLAIQLISSPLQGGQLRELARVLRGRSTRELRSRLAELSSAAAVATRHRPARTLSVLDDAAPGARAPGGTGQRPRRPTRG